MYSCIHIHSTLNSDTEIWWQNIFLHQNTLAYTWGQKQEETNYNKYSVLFDNASPQLQLLKKIYTSFYFIWWFIDSYGLVTPHWFFFTKYKSGRRTDQLTGFIWRLFLVYFVTYHKQHNSVFPKISFSFHILSLTSISLLAGFCVVVFSGREPDSNWVHWPVTNHLQYSHYAHRDGLSISHPRGKVDQH